MFEIPDDDDLFSEVIIDENINDLDLKKTENKPIDKKKKKNPRTIPK